MAVASLLDRINSYQGRPLRFLMVMPEFPISFYSYYYVGRYFGRAKASPPAGLLTIAAMCPPDWELRLVDENAEKLTGADLEWADLVGVSAMVVQYTRAVEISRLARAKGKPTIIGGNHVSGEPEAYEGKFDVLARNEGEITFREFLKDYQAGQVRSRYETSEKADLSTTPVLRWDLLKHPSRYPLITLQYSRGCIHDCEFCDVVMLLGRRIRFRKVEDVLRELDLVNATGFRELVMMADDCFGANKRKSIELCHALAAWNKKNGYPFVFATQATMQSMNDDEMLDAMRLARFESVFVGLETPSAESLRETGKTQNLNLDPVLLVRKIRSYGIRVISGIMMGFDGDGPDIFDRQIEFIHALSTSLVQASALSAFPGTPLHKRLKAEGRLLFDHTPLQLESSFGPYNSIGLPNVVPKQMSCSKLMDGYARFIADIYSPKRYFDRVVEEVAGLNCDSREKWLTPRIIFFSFPAWSLFIVLFCSFRFHYLWAALRVLARCPRHLRDFKDASMRAIHCIEFARRDLVPRAREDARRLARIEADHVSAGAAPLEPAEKISL